MAVHAITRDQFPICRHVSRCTVTAPQHVNSPGKMAKMWHRGMGLKRAARPPHTAGPSVSYLYPMRWQLCTIRRSLRCWIGRVAYLRLLPLHARMPAFLVPVALASSGLSCGFPGPKSIAPQCTEQARALLVFWESTGRNMWNTLYFVSSPL